MSDWTDVIKHSNIAISLADDSAIIWSNRLFCWIYHPDLSDKSICDEHIRWGERFAEPEDIVFLQRERNPDRRLRIGYVSPDFRAHSCRFFFEPLFAHHNHTHFELFAYANVKREDSYTQQLKTYFDAWRDIYPLSDQEVFQRIQEDQIDILVDGCGHMIDTRLELFALKPAPIQVTWLGAAWTTGLKQMDYAVFDPYMGRRGVQTSEQVVQLPRTWAAFRPDEKATNEVVTVLPALHNGYITFGYSGRTERLNYKVFRTWGDLLKRLPDARLVIDYKCFADADTRTYYEEFMAGFGIDVGRVTLQYSANIFATLGEVDILLDSFPHNGGTMLYNALWMGVPTITLAGRPPLGRIGESLMTNLGLANWVAIDEASYVEKAVAFATDFDGLAALRLGMRERMAASAVMDEEGFACDMEAAFRTMWKDWCANTDHQLEF
jgi:predicted O-linked N-acetylglucosamine transferase (SPINDLY family)